MPPKNKVRDSLATNLIMGKKEKVVKRVFTGHYTAHQVNEIVKEQAQKYKDKGLTFLVGVAIPRGWRNGKQFQTDQPISLVDKYEWTETNDFVIYAWKTNATSVGVDEHNDCLFHAMKKIISYYRLPKDVKTPEEFKTMLGLRRDEKVPMTSAVIQKIEKKMKCNLYVSGSFTFTSSGKHNYNVYLHCEDEHIEPVKNNNKPPSLIKNIPIKTKQLVVFKKYKEGIQTYDGITTCHYSFDEFRELKNQSYDSDFSYIENVFHKKQSEWSLIEKYDYYIGECEKLKEITGGKLDLSKCDYKPSYQALKVAHFNLLPFVEPEPIGELEQTWIFKCYQGALIFAEPCNLPVAYEYDLNSAYPHMMSDLHFSFPITQGEFKELDELPSIVNYGIYRIHIEKSQNENKNKLFRFNYHDYYTHLDISVARELGLSLSLIHDGQANALIYLKRGNGTQYFKSTIDYLYQFKEQSPLIKPIANSLWGALCERRKVETTTSTLVHLNNDETIIGLHPYGDYDKITYLKKGQYFKYSYGRLGCFLTSAVRKYMALKMINYKENVFRCHTDSILSDQPLPLKLSKDLGDWKVKKGSCIIKNCCDVVFTEN